MLDIILHILSILGIILLVFLGIILIFLLLVLFFPISYHIKAKRQPADSNASMAEDTNAEIKVNWLFGLLRIKYRYPTPGILKVKFLFFTVYKNDFQTKDEAIPEHTEPPKTSASQEEQAKSSKQAASNDNTIAKASLEDTIEPITQAEEGNEESSTLFEKIKYTFQKICDKIKDIIEKIKDIYHNFCYYKNVLLCEDTKDLFKYALTRIGKILKSIRPRKVHADIYFGADSPDTTGYICAGYGILCSHLGKNIVFTPDFEQAIFKGSIYAAGHITVFTILWNALMIIKDRRLWELKDKLTKKNNACAASAGTE